MAKPASTAQIDLIKRLCAERNLDPALAVAQRFGVDRELETLTGGRNGQASDLIGHLFTIGRGLDGTTKKDPEVGLYRVGDDVVRIQVSRSGNWYAQLAVTPRPGSGRKSIAWDYLGKRVDMRGATAMDDAEAGRYLKHCVRCGMELSDPDSLERGIGPVCAKK